MLIRLVILALGLALSAPQVVAEVAAPEVAAPVQGLSEALQMTDVVEVLREEGLASGADLTGKPGDPGWQLTLSRIYDLATMRGQFDLAFAAALEGDQIVITGATGFFASPLGQQVLSLEIAARRALLDPATEDAAKLAFAALEKDNPKRLALLRRFVQVNDLIEMNVMGSLNSNLAFFRGVATEGGEAYGMSEADMLAEVWAGEAQARQDTEDWIFPFLAMAYQPLSDADLQIYIDFSDSMVGRKVNAAMFAAFDELFAGISNQLGRAVARQMSGQDI